MAGRKPSRAANQGVNPGVDQGVNRGAGFGIELLFAGTMLLSAFLLFLVQPMFGRMILPRLGGTAAVWVTVTLFFQLALLAGYCYAHALSTWLTPGRQIIAHALLCLAALLLLPVAIPANWSPPTTRPPQGDLILLMALTVGLPFMAVSATAPLLQRWYSLTGLKGALDPYYLYAASNLGSLAALLGYPSLVEPWLGLKAQSVAWSLGICALLVALVACALATLRLRRAETPTEPSAAPAGGARADGAAGLAPTWRRRLYWIALAAAPSSLFLGVTTQIATDIASVPLLWILPLTIYLTTFVIAFARRPLIGRSAIARAIPYAAAIIVLVHGFETSIGLPQIVISVILLFVLALACHSELAAARPAPARLTEYYLLMSLGGALGGAFNALLAPLLFSDVYEYPMAIVLALALWAVAQSAPRPSWWWLAPGAALFLGLRLGLGEAAALGALRWMLGLKVAAALLCFALRRKPAAMVLAVAVLLAASADVALRPELARYRSFFGVHRIEIDAAKGAHLLTHGDTLHGAQFTDAARRRWPLTYFGQQGPAGQAIAALRRSGPVSPTGIIGLGAGTMACLRSANETWSFFEIDPAIVATARDPRYFTYLADCAPEAKVILGDGRLSLAALPDGGFRLLVLDAFGSDSIPVHLLTREAFDLYFRKLAPEGVLLVHFSNRNANLLPVLARLGQDRGLARRWQFYRPGDTPEDAMQTASEWAVFAREERDLAALADDPRWQPLPDAHDRPVWTDDYVNILSVMIWPRWTAPFGAIP